MADGNFNNDDKVDMNDLSVALTNYDKTYAAAAGASAAGITAIPEPSALALVAAGIVGLLAYVGRRRRDTI
jgi:hypothetical protein